MKINESKLREVVSKCISDALSEIGDTPAGRTALANAIGKAHGQGRFAQADLFRRGLDNAVVDQYGDGATNYKLDYNSWRYKVRLFPDGRVLKSDIDGYNKGEDDLGRIIQNRWDDLKTKDRTLARRISKWCAEFMNKDLPYYQECLDWHNWAKL
jgi:hypothetical protein